MIHVISLTPIQRTQQVVQLAAVRNANAIECSQIELHMKSALFTQAIQVSLVDPTTFNRLREHCLNRDQAILSSIIGGLDPDALIEIAQVTIVTSQNSCALLGVCFIDLRKKT